MGVKLKSARIKLVKRRLDEVLEFFKYRLLDHLLWEESYIVDGKFEKEQAQKKFQVNNIYNPTDSFMEVILVDTIVQLHRNDLTP